MKRIKSLKRLVRLTDLIYRLEAAKAAQISHAQAELEGTVESVRQYVDGDEGDEYGPGFLKQIAVTRAVRLQRELRTTEAELEAQISVARDGLAGLKGAQSKLLDEKTAAARTEEQALLESAIDGRIVRRARPE